MSSMYSVSEGSVIALSTNEGSPELIHDSSDTNESSSGVRNKEPAKGIISSTVSERDSRGIQEQETIDFQEGTGFDMFENELESDIDGTGESQSLDGKIPRSDFTDSERFEIEHRWRVPETLDSFNTRIALIEGKSPDIYGAESDRISYRIDSERVSSTGLDSRGYETSPDKFEVGAEVIEKTLIDLESEDDIDNLDELEQLRDGELQEIVGIENNGDGVQGVSIIIPQLVEDGGVANGKSNLKELHHDDIENTPTVKLDKAQVEETIIIPTQLDSAIGHSPPIVLHIFDTEFLLCPIEEKNQEDFSHLVSFHDDKGILDYSIEEFFGLIRSNEDLREIKEINPDEELVLEVPELGKLYITEDNVYTREINVKDFVTSFIRLSENTEQGNDIPNSITFLLSLKPRFIGNFNKLSNFIRSGKGFTQLKDAKKHWLDLEENPNPKKRRVDT